MKEKKYKLVRLGLIYGCWLLVTTLSGQTLSPKVVASSGGSGQNTGYTLEWTLGETATHTSSAQGYTLTQGFHQPKLVEIVGSIDLNVDIDIDVYPNPLVEGVHIKTEDRDLNYRIVNVEGKVLQPAKSLQVGEDYIDCSGISDGIFLLQIYNGQRQVKVVKLKKN